MGLRIKNNSTLFGKHCFEPIPRLHMACALGVPPWINSLLSETNQTQSLALLDHRDHRGSTALFHAVRSGSLQVTTMLLQRSTNVNATDVDGDSALMVAIRSPMSWRIVKNESFHLNDMPEGEELQVRVRIKRKKDKAPMVRLLLENGSDPKLASLDTVTPLCEATLMQDKALVQLLLEFGADPEAAMTGLPVAPAHVSVQMCPRSLFTLKVDDHPGLGYNCTALHIAVAHGCWDIVNLLIDHGANLNAMTWAGETALTIALRLHFLDVAALLGARGARIPQTEPNYWYIPSDRTLEGKNRFLQKFHAAECEYEGPWCTLSLCIVSICSMRGMLNTVPILTLVRNSHQEAQELQTQLPQKAQHACMLIRRWIQFF